MELQDTKLDVKVKLAGLWASAMFCYIYCDYFELYRPGVLSAMTSGTIDPFGHVTQGLLLAFGSVMIPPSLMIFLSLALPARFNRWLNGAVGAFYTLFMLAIFIAGGWAFYRLYAAVEILLTISVVYYALRWPAAARS